jgi:hypothetical protein
MVFGGGGEGVGDLRHGNDAEPVEDLAHLEQCPTSATGSPAVR